MILNYLFCIISFIASILMYTRGEIVRMIAWLVACVIFSIVALCGETLIIHTRKNKKEV